MKLGEERDAKDEVLHRGRSIDGLRAVDKRRHHGGVRILSLLVVALPALTAAPAVTAADGRDLEVPVPAARVGLHSTTFLSDRGYDDDGVGATEFPLTVERIALDIEVDAAPRLRLFGTLPFVLAHVDNGGVEDAGLSGFDTMGFGDAAVGMQLGILTEAPFFFGLRGDVKLPLYDAEPTLRGRGPDGLRPAIGDGQVDVTVSGVVDATFPFDGALHWDTGYRLRSDDVSDAVVGGGELGVALLDRALWPSWRLRYVYSLDPRVVDDVVVEATGAGYVSTGPACRVALPFVAGLALDVGANFLFRGRNAAGGFELVFGVSYEF